MVIADFRTQFPEFSDVAVYPDALINAWAAVAERMVVLNVWTTSWTFGCQLYVAHEITLAAQNQKAASVGGTPGVSGGIASSKTVGSVSVTYDASSTTEKDGGWWNLTNYGKQYLRLARIFGAGVIQL
jgi:hypothetical protein